MKYMDEEKTGAWASVVPLLINQSNSRSKLEINEFFYYFLLIIYLEPRATNFTPYEIMFGRKSTFFC